MSKHKQLNIILFDSIRREKKIVTMKLNPLYNTETEHSETVCGNYASDQEHFGEANDPTALAAVCLSGPDYGDKNQKCKK